MPSSWSTLKIELIGSGEQAGTWGTTTNDNLGSSTTGSRGLEQAIVGMATLVTGDFTSNSYTLPYNDTNANQDFRALVLNITATLSAAGEVIVPAIEKPYIVMNNSVGGYAVTVKVSGQTGISVPNGAKILVYNDGTDVGTAITHLTSLTLASALPVASGGTGQTTYTNGQLLIGNTTGNTLTKATLTAGSGVSITNGAGSITIAATNAGTVTSVSGTGTVNGITLTGTVTSSGNLTLGGALSGVSLTTQVTGTLPIANGGTGTTSTQFVNLATNVTGDLPFANLAQGSALSVLGVTGNATADVASIAAGTDNQVLRRSGTSVAFGAVNLASSDAVTGILPVANGGTGNAFFTVSGPASTAKTYTFPNENTTVVGLSQTQTLTNKRVTPRIGTVADAATITPTGDDSDQYNVTALAQSATIAAPSGTPTNGQKLVIRIKDNGTARALTWTTSSGAYRAVGVTLPTTTVISKVVYIGCIYNAQDTFWDVVAVSQQA